MNLSKLLIVVLSPIITRSQSAMSSLLVDSCQPHPLTVLWPIGVLALNGARRLAAQNHNSQSPCSHKVAKPMRKVESMSDVLGKLVHAFDVDAPQLFPAGIQPSQNPTARVAVVYEVDADFERVAVRELGLVAAGLTML